MDKKTKIILILIVLMALFLRVYNLGSTSLGFFRDEAALGYNSWAILKTGADEFGQKLPIIFRSFEVFFMPAYVYFSLPIFLIFGLSEFSARLLAAISGTVIVFTVFFIARKIFRSKVSGLIASFVVATSPWAIFYSRGSFEGNLALMFFVIGIYFWVNFFENKRRIYFFVSIFWFILSMYSYQAPRFVAPLFIGLSIFVTKKWYKNWRLWICGAIFAAILYLPVIVLSLSPASYHRAAGVSIFNNKELSNSLPIELLSLYTAYYSPANLFWNGDYNLQRNVPNFSVFYIICLPFFIIGLWNLYKNKIKLKKYLAIWFLIAPIPAALTADPFHTYRAILFWIPVSLIISFGVYLSYKKFNRRVYLASYVGLTLFFTIYFMFSLMKIAPVLYWRSWDYGYREISDYVKSQSENYRVVIDDNQTESYIHFLFYNNISLETYQKIASETLEDRYYSSSEELRPIKVGRFEFRTVDWPSERGDKNTIFIFPSERLQPSEFKDDPKLKWDRTIIAPDGKDAFYIIKS